MQGEEVPHYFTPRIGEYDMWAIKYGYMPVEGEELLAEHEVREVTLTTTAQQGAPGLHH